MMSDGHDAGYAKRDFELTELVGLIGNAYVRQGLSPPTQLHGAVRHCLGLSHGEILAAIESHFAEHRRLYTSGSGDRLFYLVEAALRRALEANYPRAYTDEELDRPRRRRAGGVRPVHNAAGARPDVFVEGDAARVLRRNEGAGEPIGLEDDHGEDM
jgi:hypothetical protein